MGGKTRGGEQVDLVDCGSVMVGEEVGGAAGVTAGCRVVWRKLHAALVRDGGAAAETDLLPPPHPGEKGDSGSRCHLLSLSVPSSFSQLVCLSLLWLLPPPSAAGKKFEIIRIPINKSKGDLEKILNQASQNYKNPSITRNYCK